MAEKVGDLSGDEREQRVAELKRKMQEAAHKKAQAAPAEQKPVAATVAAPVAASAPVAVAVAEAPVAVATVAEPAADIVTPVDSPVAAVATPTAAVAQPTAAPRPPAARTEAVAAPVEVEGKGINRREFLTYAWGAALGLLTLEAGVGTFMFLYPRFRAGEFGGDFIQDTNKFGDKDAAPNPEPSGKFWQVTTAEGQHKALYMVCVHLGCLYKWVPANNRFECPCHGSKYTHDGFYIEGPATRSLDTFEVTDEGDKVVVHTGKKIVGAPASESPARAPTV
ncbi:MAG: Rieske 2Fe-2S domain-containing protein [Chloroflexi bacterium]|nr:Rieske 2Fe-2S domain-containing protein [Chloroflexota bacterium]